MSVMAVSGSMGYFKQRAALKAAGKDVPLFRVRDLAKSMVTSKAALMAGGMTALAAALPGALMIAASGGVAAIGAGLYDYKSRRAQDRARGIAVGPPSLRDAFKTVFKSKSAGTAFLMSVGIGTILSLVTGTSWSPADNAGAPDLNQPDLKLADNAAGDASLPQGEPLAPWAEPGAPMPEMAASSSPAPAAAPEAAPVQALVESPVAAATVPEIMPHAAEPEIQIMKDAPVESEAIITDDVITDDVISGNIAATEAAPVIADAAPNEVVFDNTGPDGVRQILYGSGIIETIYPAEPVSGVVDTAVTDTPVVDSPVVDSPEAAIAADSAPAAERSEDVPADAASPTEDGQGAAPTAPAAQSPSTIAPLYADAAQPEAPAPAQTQTIGECVISEDDLDVHVECTLDMNAQMQPGASIEFRSAAHPENIMQAVLPADAAPMNAGEFLEQKALPGAYDAYEKGFFKPGAP